VHLSYFLRDQLYPGDYAPKPIGWFGVPLSAGSINIATEVLSGKDFVCKGAVHL
jgi:hypothetical protein